MPQIELNHVDKSYAANGLRVNALTDVSLTFDKGDFGVLAGPSGSGKSTLLHVLGGLDHADAGSVTVAGLSLGQLSPSALAEFRLMNVGFIFQAYNLIPVLTALENVEYPLLLQKSPPQKRRACAIQLLEEVGLSDQLHKRPNEMSGGQQQRVAAARALVTTPKIVLADEPTANLDSKTGGELIDLFLRLNESHHVTFLCASHDPMVIERARRVVRLKDGRVVA